MMIVCIRIWLMWICSLWLCSKPSHSSFLPLLSTNRELKISKTNNNLLRQKMIRSTSNGGIMKNVSSEETSSDMMLRQGGMVAYLPFLSSSILNFITQRTALVALSYILVANTIYLQRRAHLRKMTKRKLLQIRTTREEGVNLGLHVTNIFAWQVFVTSVFPILEPLSRLCGFVSFYYFYPNANGCGIIFEPVSVQHLPIKKRQRSQLRLDWHKFSFNVGQIGRDGYRHPPSIERNLPHLDVPRLQLKHWPWRRKHNKADVKK
ncbi:hypothetical protein QTG54_000466 [Skeletonema marinoi]|uniref:Uncharacterized protein n=1 Tax=Skeletonema marinoi TaxID=267567 RepID=A0AAD9DIK0_9STRA|nr:hypothetical protein QTG54_000466 [Skeletonema marinoi]